MSINNFINPTKNQHFISQAEQRLNSCSEFPESKKSEIYCFNIENKNPARVSLNGKSAIWRNLSFQDLFTILRTPNEERVNFESLFDRYEGEFSTRAANLLKRIDKARSASANQPKRINLTDSTDSDFSEMLADVKFIYKYKLMSAIRNPYKIKDTLKKFKFALNLCLNDNNALQLYLSLEAKNKSEEKYICNTYNISSEEYRDWIRLILLLLYLGNDDTTILDGFVDEFFNAKEFSTYIMIHIFDNDYALLPDTGVVQDSLSDCIIMYVNVSKNCIFALSHTKIDGETLDKMCEIQNLSGAHREKLIDDLGGKVYGSLYINDLSILSGYNKMCVQTSANQVFSGALNIAGVEITTIDKCIDSDS